VNWPTLLLYAGPAFPLALTCLALWPAARGHLIRALPVAPLPALAAALLLPPGLSDSLPNTMLGAGLALEETGRIFLGVGALLWSAAGVFATAYISEGRARFAGFWLATLSGNMLLFVAADVVTFYLAFAILSLSAFGLVVHEGHKEARRAARVYLLLAVFGETCLLLGLLVGAHGAGSILTTDVRQALATSTNRELAIGLLVAGFGLKAGLMPLHVWLPLAHSAAPVPASAVLSGAIVNAGIFGLVAFLPLEADLPGWSAALVVLGLATAYGGILFGIVQTRPKTVLAYSTLSQMGLVVVLIGSGFGSPGAGFVIAAAALYCAHHGLAKGALFLSVGVIGKSSGRVRGLAVLLAGLPALAVAGLPFTGGALAKLALKGPMGGGAAVMFVTLSAVGTTLLMLRFLDLVRREPPGKGAPPAGLLAPFFACVGAALAVPWILFPELTQFALGYALSPANLWGALWPILVGAAVMAGALRLRRLPQVRVPEGDLVVLMERGFRLIMIGMRRADRFRLPKVPMPKGPDFAIAERALGRWPMAGTLLLGAVGLVAAMVSR
jgi:hydrogenase-4 component B